ncbi:unnamed protein product, partial [Onchocerca flexuosa]|uniref:Copine domain-containing protein n=1 Tax=Onchocerca flexuosa TaxID=387005 RepID=A0A183HXI8_9BILA
IIVGLGPASHLEEYVSGSSCFGSSWVLDQPAILRSM